MPVMGPDNPWSPTWRPDPTGRRIASIRAARRGGLIAGVVYVVVGAAMLALGTLPQPAGLVALAIGLPGVALLGAGLAPSTLGSRPDAVVTGVAFAVGAPVAAVTSIALGALVLSTFALGELGLVGPVIRAGVLAAIAVLPLVVLAATAWVIVTRAVGRPGTARRSLEATDQDGVPRPRP
jgi:hypothetical protein